FARFRAASGCDSVRPSPFPPDAAMKQPDLAPLLHRIADALERLAPAAVAVNDLEVADAFIWHAEREWLEPVPVVNRVALGLLRLLSLVRGSSRRCVLFCDDLSFDQNDASYKSLKAVLEGGIEGRPANVVLYATSNRRHLMPRDMIENERSTAINPAEAVEEKVSLSDRFGLWLGFHNVDQETYHAIVRGYAAHFGLDLPVDQLMAEANEWSITRGSRSGRVAWQFIQDLAGRLGKPTS